MEINNLREKFIDYFEMKISSNELNTWFENIDVELVNDNELRIYAENEFASDWIRMKYSTYIQDAADQVKIKI